MMLSIDDFSADLARFKPRQGHLFDRVAAGKLIDNFLLLRKQYQKDLETDFIHNLVRANGYEWAKVIECVGRRLEVSISSPRMGLKHSPSVVARMDPRTRYESILYDILPYKEFQMYPSGTAIVTSTGMLTDAGSPGFPCGGWLQPPVMTIKFLETIYKVTADFYLYLLEREQDKLTLNKEDFAAVLAAHDCAAVNRRMFKLEKALVRKCSVLAFGGETTKKLDDTLLLKPKSALVSKGYTVVRGIAPVFFVYTKSVSEENAIKLGLKGMIVAAPGLEWAITIN